MRLAKKVQNQELQVISPLIIQTLEEALKYHQANDLKQAEKHYKKALVASREHPEVTILCAVFYQQIARHKYVITLLKKVLAKEPLNFKALHLIGKSYLEEQQFEPALQALQQAYTLDPNHVEVCFKKGFCHHKMGQLDFILPLYEKAFEGIEHLADADQHSLFHCLADFLMAEGRRNEAITYLEMAVVRGVANGKTLLRLAIAKGEGIACSMVHILEALKLDKNDHDAQEILALACEKGNIPSLVTPFMKGVLQACLENSSLHYQSLSLPWVRNLFISLGEDGYKDVFKITSYDEFVELFNKEEIRAELCSKYFVLGLKTIRPLSTEMERFYRFMRMYFLTLTKEQKRLDTDELVLLGALAEQCYLNEYVFSVSNEEGAFILELKERLEGLSSFGEEHSQELLLLATFEPLLNLSNHQQLSNSKVVSALDDVYTQQIREPLSELRLQKKIKTIGCIENEVSQSVRDQYEENPYPRWKAESFFAPFHTQMVDAEYRNKSSVLIAGCGTGKHIVSSYNFYQNADFTAIDISKASLAYAKRKLIDYGIDKKVSLYQCDILDVKKIGRSFDFIECCGVLHHMQDPLQGLRALASILKQEGTLKLALYSRTARQSVYDVRDFIKGEGFEPTAEGIRACRERIVETDFSGESTFPIYQWRDFQSLSECRDLMFHRQEICYDCTEIEKMLEAAGLVFESMQVNSVVQQKFSEMFAGEVSEQNLKSWGEFEAANPRAFAGMYQFKVRKQP